MVKAKIKLKNPTGLHLRPAGILCNEAVKFDCSVQFQFRGTVSNAKSVLSVLGACIKSGDEIEFICDGKDEEEALSAMLTGWASRKKRCGKRLCTDVRIGWNYDRLFGLLCGFATSGAQPPLSFIRRRASGGGGVSVCVRLYPEWKSSASAGDFRSFLCRWTGTGVYEA